MKDYEVMIIGAGQAALPLALKLVDKGWRVAISERKHLGGSCVNFGCTPTKAVVASARVAHLARRAAEFGILVPGVDVDFAKVLGRARAIVEASKSSLASGLHEHHVDIVHGQARFAGRDGEWYILCVDHRDIRAKQVVINTGARTRLPPIEGLEDVAFLHAGNWLESDHLPKHVIFAGAGYIALEMAQFYRRMGAQVTVVGPGKQVADHEDPDVAQALQRILADEEITFRLGGRVKAVAREASGVRVSVRTDGETGPIAGSHLFIATGRRPNTDDLSLDTIGLTPDKDGVIEVDDRLATRAAGVWVAGDARGGPMFTHTSWDDHRVLESQLLGDGSRTTAGRIVPYAIFTDPELGRVGMTEAEARRKYGEEVKTATFEMKQNGKATEQGETRGFIKLIADGRDGRLLGAAVLAVEGAELVASYITLMNAGATLAPIRQGIYIHPTLSEAIQSAASVLEL
jgi:pyruvate/2-oxoglutarate dehydrogenase complex dihydrolipoamide dehydrogenase (E3) component